MGNENKSKLEHNSREVRMLDLVTQIPVENWHKAELNTRDNDKYGHKFVTNLELITDNVVIEFGFNILDRYSYADPASSYTIVAKTADAEAIELFNYSYIDGTPEYDRADEFIGNVHKFLEEQKQNNIEERKRRILEEIFESANKKPQN